MKKVMPILDIVVKVAQALRFIFGKKKGSKAVDCDAQEDKTTLDKAA